MYHQFGAADAYPVESTLLQSWKGVGNWDIMASGNWNETGLGQHYHLTNYGINRC